MMKKTSTGRREFFRKVGLGAAGIVASSTLDKWRSAEVLADEPTGKLPRRKLGRNDLMASTLALGAGSRFTGEQFLSAAERERYLSYAMEQGVNYIDTAIHYGNSEQLLGNILTPSDWDNLILSTKTTSKTYDGVMADFKTSKGRLKRDHFDVYLLHEKALSNNVEGNADAFRALQDLREAGDVSNIGYSTHGTLSPPMAVKLVEEFDLDHCILTTSRGNRADYRETIPDIVDKGCTVAAFKVARYLEGEGPGSGVADNYRDVLKRPISSAVISHSNAGEGVTWKDVLDANLTTARDFEK
ncbi:MAG: aldo/keto reductase [Planctomycetota bacterium]